MPEPAFDPARRGLLTGRRNRPQPLRPPWARSAAILDACTRCGACARACPEGVIAAGDGGFPEMDFRAGECSFCRACADACPQPGLFAPAAEAPWQATARIAEGCLALAGVHCQSCADACPERAIRFTPALRSAPRPRIEPVDCTGCGACVAGCPAQAIRVLPDPASGAMPEVSLG